MEKLLTEDSVRQLMRQNKLANQDQLTLPRGTILTPAARSFLGEHRVKIKQTNGSSIDVQSKKTASPNSWLETLRVATRTVDFGQLTQESSPLIRLQQTLREQFLLLLTVIDKQIGVIDQSQMMTMAEFVNELLTKSFDQVLANEDYPIDQVKLTDFDLSKAPLLLVQQLQSSVGQVAFSLGDYIQVQPELRQATYCRAIIQWQNQIQAWTQKILER
ncbi:hypothetical protein [Levilactobacillus brevis]|uniref:hypothetical protein n=1 Tax=Levilactobacillus brevis TaxID=1580 RepID=UPI0035A3C574